MVSQKSHSIGYVCHILTKESMKSTSNVNKLEVVQNKHAVLPSTNLEPISNGKLSDHVRDIYPHMVNFHLYILKLEMLLMYVL